MTAAAEPNDDNGDWDDRRLCPDDVCTGVLDDAGKCPICGKQGAASQGGPRQVAKAEPAPEPVKAAPVPAGGDELDERELCPDGACIGVIGSDGRCKVCGKSL